MVEPQAEIAAAITANGRVGVLATPNTVESGAYRRALEAQGRALEVIEVEAPDLAPFIQDGSLFDEERMAMARTYCAPLQRGRGRHPDPRLHPLPAGGADAAADPRPRRPPGQRRPRRRRRGPAHARGRRPRPPSRGGEGTYDFLCTGDSDAFRAIGTRFLQMPLGEVERVEI